MLLDEEQNSREGAGLIALEAPKTRNMGGRIQHVLITCPWVTFFLASVRNLLQPSPEGRLFPYSYGTLLRRWKQVLLALGLPLLWTPAGLRAGGATWLYRSGTPIDYIRLRGRWRAPSSLERYVQEAAAFAVMQQLPAERREFIRQRANNVWEVIVAALGELATQSAAGYSTDAVDLIMRPHPVMRRLLRRRRLKELQRAWELAEESG